MKKMLLFIISLFPIFVWAKEYDIKDINLKLNVSDDWTVFTRDNLDNNEELKSLGLTKELLLPSYEKQGIYFDGINNDVELLVIIPDIKLDVNNLSHFDNDVLKDTGKELAKKVGTDKYSTYTAKHKFAVINYFDKATNLYIVNYYTVANAKGYNFQIQKATEINSDDIKKLENVVDTVEIEELPGFEKEKEEYTKKTFSFKNILIGALIGAVVGGLSSLVLKLTKKKSSN